MNTPSIIVKCRSYVRSPVDEGTRGHRSHGSKLLFPAGSTPSWALAGWKVVALRMKNGYGHINPLHILSYALGLSHSEVRRRLNQGQFLWARGGDRVEIDGAIVAHGTCIILDPKTSGGIYSVVEIRDWRHADH